MIVQSSSSSYPVIEIMTPGAESLASQNTAHERNDISNTNINALDEASWDHIASYLTPKECGILSLMNRTIHLFIAGGLDEATNGIHRGVDKYTKRHNAIHASARRILDAVHPYVRSLNSLSVDEILQKALTIKSSSQLTFSMPAHVLRPIPRCTTKERIFHYIEHYINSLRGFGFDEILNQIENDTPELRGTPELENFLENLPRIEEDTPELESSFDHHPKEPTLDSQEEPRIEKAVITYPNNFEYSINELKNSFRPALTVSFASSLFSRFILCLTSYQRSLVPSNNASIAPLAQLVYWTIEKIKLVAIKCMNMFCEKPIVKPLTLSLHSPRAGYFQTPEDRKLVEDCLRQASTRLHSFNEPEIDVANHQDNSLDAATTLADNVLGIFRAEYSGLILSFNMLIPTPEEMNSAASESYSIFYKKVFEEFERIKPKDRLISQTPTIEDLARMKALFYLLYTHNA